ncbi:MAG: SCO family protein [Planctomycetes bacterium]|nr:SCO family protein [Planctomycetota bacterium]MCB9870282.1 SCO family protein [Planctomycetota bacterium]MCB9888138.1 SCO family protein [Planctomycetota bacterium]
MTPRPSTLERPRHRLKLAAAACVAMLAGGLSAQTIGLQVEDEATLIQQKLGAFAAKDATFRDETGREVRIGDYLNGARPVVLNLQWYSCPSLCGPVIRGLLQAVNAISLQPGDYTVLSVSFDHREKQDLASYKKKSVLTACPKPGAAEHWHFLTGDEASIRKLTESVGYGFRWNTTRKDFDHRAALIFLAPDGKITRYFRGAYYDPATFRLAIVEASNGKVGTALDRFRLTCYGYDPLTGTYSTIGPNVMAAGGALTLLGLGTLLFFLFRNERQRHRQPAQASASAS